MILIHPYLDFDGCCEEALEFYRAAIGAEVLLMLRYDQSPEPIPAGMIPPGAEKKVMHASFRIGESEIQASDSHCAGNARFQGIALSIKVDDEPEAERIVAALSEGGTITVPIMKTFFSKAFASLIDRFGVTWTIVAPS